MLKSFVLVISISCLFHQVFSQSASCPSENGWLFFSNKCYKYTAFPRLDQPAASAYCADNGATLLSVNSLEEHNFVAGWLQTNDMRRESWLTSGITTNAGIRWLGDGTGGALEKWIPNIGPSRNAEGFRVVYNYTGTEYLWATSQGSVAFSFICEISVNEVYRILQQKRDFDYGLNIDNPGLAPKGPSFIFQPQDTVVLQKKISSITLDCMAQGNPQPTYDWMKLDRENKMIPLTPGNRYSFTTGYLEITEPTVIDEATYQCKAKNEYGLIISSSATLSFGELGEFSNVNPAPVNGIEYDGAQLECPYIIGRPAKNYQWYKNDYTSFVRPEFQIHTFISANGKLYFSELAPSDVGEYYCLVELASLSKSNSIVASQVESRTSLPFRLNVVSGAGSQFQPKIQNDFIFIFPPTPTKGDTVRLECFAYGTGPLVYSWSREGGKSLPNNSTLKFNNRILILQDVELVDGGKYTCKVHSQKTNLDDSRTIELTIQAKPYFTYPLTHQHVDVGSQLTWHCEADGRPTPTYQWYKNGEILKSSEGVLVDVNTLTITAVDGKRDNGMYQCAATNRYGTTFTSAQLRVLELAPSFEKNPMSKIQAGSIGGNVTIICDPIAAPFPTYTWLKDGSNLNLVPGAPGDHYRVLMNGNLLIQGIQQSDKGKYTCQVENKFGKTEDHTSLEVYTNTVLSRTPSDQKVMVNGTVELQCQASHASDIDMVYIWKFNDHVIDYIIEPEYRLGEGIQKGSLYILPAHFDNEGMYTCLPTTGMNQMSASAFVTVYGPPGEPAGVYTPLRTVIKSDDSALINPNTSRYIIWTDGDSRGSIITDYYVEFRTNFDMRWRTHPDGNKIPQAITINDMYPDKRFARLTNLKAGASIQFRVKAVNIHGIGAPSLPTAEIYIPGSQPSQLVTNVRGGGGSVGDLTVLWDPLPKEDHNGENLKYKVSWRTLQAGGQSDTSKWRTIIVAHDSACRNLPDFKTGLVYVCKYVEQVGQQMFYTPYQVTIQAINDYGEGPITPEAVVMSAEEMPIGAPESVKAKPYNGTALMVTWKPVPNTRESVRGKIKGYKINYWNKTNEVEADARQNIIELKPGQTNLDRGLIIGLEPTIWYNFNVQVYSSAGNGPKSSTYDQQTWNRMASQYPTEVYVYSIEGFGVRVNFRGISTQKREEPLLGYKVQVWKAYENLHSAREVDFGMLSTGVIRNLSSSELYQLRIFAYSRAGQGKRSSPSVYFTVGDGQIQINAETTDIFAGVSILKPSLITLFIISVTFILFNLNF
ncbi:contactin-like [Biomphalaria glabrata]|uniref:Contactin-like n=1 Tax=Biomphalaria glabrata TaxID=6526 RepID=A0A9W3AAG8_BIOGL|nr:contactin-like [Biomphalaria glabrata]XP_055884201.1 contactin-like [Biomphalaria glabrata]XP_055884202.1 contactin-like [Biomphalaria glabrata]XP_055884203.1 contactin-like [Biomphalaria glabrata]